MEKIKTNDGSFTFFNEKYKESYHSVSGAKEEAIEKFVKPCLKKKNPKILDVCFGLGYNSAAALEYFKNCKIIGLENDKEILNKIKEINVDFKNYDIIKKAAENLEYENVRIILGDARETVLNLKDNYFDVVFFDPFSIKKCPELWDYFFLKDIYKKMKINGVLTCYSCSKLFRNNLIKIGFLVEDGPKIGRKSPSTIAIKKFRKV